MKRRKRFTIRLVALGLAVAALSAPAAQAGLDEGVNGLQPPYTERLVTADDIGRPSPVSSQPTVVQSDDGIQIWPVAMTIVLLLGAGAAFRGVHQVRKGKLASA